MSYGRLGRVWTARASPAVADGRRRQLHSAVRGADVLATLSMFEWCSLMLPVRARPRENEERANQPRGRVASFSLCGQGSPRRCLKTTTYCIHSMAPKSTPRKPSHAVPASTTAATSTMPTTPSAAASQRPNAGPSPSSPSSASSGNAITQLWDAYTASTPARLKLIDAFLVFVMLSGVACFAYCVLITDFPFNAFLGACVPATVARLTETWLMRSAPLACMACSFSSCVGQFVLLASLRSQVNPENKVDFPSVSPERYARVWATRTRR